MLKTTTTCDSPPLICPTSDTDKLAILTTTFAELMSSPTNRKNGIASSASEFDAVKNLLDDRGQRDVGKGCADEDAGQQRERHGYAEISEKQEAERHQRQDDGSAHGCRLPARSVTIGGTAKLSSAGSGWSNPFLMPLTSCSIVNSAISTPDKGMTA